MQDFSIYEFIADIESSAYLATGGSTQANTGSTPTAGKYKKHFSWKKIPVIYLVYFNWIQGVAIISGYLLFEQGKILWRNKGFLLFSI